MSTDAELAEPMSSSNWPFVINVANSIIGVSILALPFCFKECGLILGLLLLLGSSWLTRVTCHLLIKTATVTKRRTYEYLAFHIFGTAGKFTVEVSIIGMLIGTCIAFYIIIGDLGPAILSKFYGIENTPNLRTVLLIVVTVLGALPLGMLRSLESVSRFSALSLMFYGIFALHVVSSAFANFWSGVWLSKVYYWNLDGLFKSLPIIAIAFACQTQLFIVYEALPESSLKRMDDIVGTAVGLCTVVYALVGCFGYVAFYDHEISGDVLMNFRPTLFSELIKVGFVSSTIMSFPLVIFPCRASIYTLFFTQRQNLHRNLTSATYIPPLHFKLITVGVVLFSLCVGIVIPNVEFMLSITGATMGSLICFILPAVMSMSVSSLGQGKQKYKAQFVLFVGMTILLASTYVTISTQERLIQQESVVKLAQPIEHHDSDAINEAEINRLLSDKELIGDNQKNSSSQSSTLSYDLNERKKPDLKELSVDSMNDVLAATPKLPPVIDTKDDDKRKEPPNPREPIELHEPPEPVKDEQLMEPLLVGQEERVNQQPNAVAALAERLNDQQLPHRTLEPDGNVEEIGVGLTAKYINISQADSDKLKNGAMVADSQKLVKRIIVIPESFPSQNKTVNELVPKEAVDAVNASSRGLDASVQNKEQNGDVAKRILDELQRNQEVQKLLLDEQRQIVDELRRHDLELHQELHHHHDEKEPLGPRDLLPPTLPRVIQMNQKAEQPQQLPLQPQQQQQPQQLLQQQPAVTVRNTNDVVADSRQQKERNDNTNNASRVVDAPVAHSQQLKAVGNQSLTHLGPFVKNNQPDTAANLRQPVNDINWPPLTENSQNKANPPKISVKIPQPPGVVSMVKKPLV